MSAVGWKDMPWVWCWGALVLVGGFGGDGKTWGRWTLDALRCVERHGSAPRPYAKASVWAACATELAGMGCERTACARAESLGAFDATLASNLAHW